MYGRMLGEIYLGDLNLNVEQLKQGFAEEYIWNANEVDAPLYRQAEKSAKDAGRGIWELENYESPQDFRQRTKED
jgi:micrococcal nuclease